MGAWKDRSCRKCETLFSPAKKNQIYCDGCVSLCRMQGCQEPASGRGYCAKHLRHHATPVTPIPMRDGGLCGVDECERQAFARGYCQLHYDRVRHTGSVGASGPTLKKPRGGACEIQGCDGVAVGDGLCIRHYARRRKTGQIGPAERLRREMGTGSITEDGYKVIVVDGDYVYEHRYVMEQELGRTLLPGENIHHRDGNRQNNDPANLECWISQQPSGQRVTDLVEFALKILQQYPNALAEEGYRLLPLESVEATKTLMGDPACEIAGAYLQGLLANS